MPNDKGGEDLFALIGTTETPERFAEWRRARQERLDAMSAKGPKPVSMDPADGATDVDPSLTAIRFTLDRPIKSGMSLMRVDGTFPESAGKPFWDEERRVLSFPVRLKHATTYRFGLNAQDYYTFRDRDGSPLRPLVMTFRTR